MIEETNEQKYSGKLWYSKEQELQIKIQLWAPRIGLERQVVKSIQKKDMERCRKQLLDVAANIRFSNTQSKQDEGTAKCQEILRHSILFALHIGMAQAP